MIAYSLTTYFYFLTMVTDPGYIPKSSSRAQQKAVIDELLEIRKFDEANFCVHCMVRRPLRSKHCKRCNRCVAKEDHHCPWVDNCVANNNHRHFVMYISCLEAGILLLVRLVLSYLTILPPPTETPECNMLDPELCSTLHKDTFTIILSIWATLQLIWVTMLLVVQLLQIARAQTTFEAMRNNAHGHGHTPDPLTSFLTTGSTSAVGGQVDAAGAGPAAPGQRRHQKTGCLEQWKRMLGIDTFIATALHGSNAPAILAQRRENPFTRGCITNCRDFWCDSAPMFKKRENGEALLGGDRINWTRVYEPPPKMRARRGGAVADEGGRYESLAAEEDEV